ncbi:LAFE_0H02850g1_1 [Lachancea fermentati]|uniref:LAFE_0H02850g1_1 n=1 Tax=Lachancea fermentati TaxID=4955 RepID=A0A1G4MJ99_LACFM|nr:LAFE_0H02850g1_1 [Lachancea fermentati]
MRGGPRSLEEFFYHKLMQSPAFHRFVRRIYYKVNGLTDTSTARPSQNLGTYHPSTIQKFNAYRILFWDEIRSTFGLSRKFKNNFKP